MPSIISMGNISPPNNYQPHKRKRSNETPTSQHRGDDSQTISEAPQILLNVRSVGNILSMDYQRTARTMGRPHLCCHPSRERKERPERGLCVDLSRQHPRRRMMRRRGWEITRPRKRKTNHPPLSSTHTTQQTKRKTKGATEIRDFSNVLKEETAENVRHFPDFVQHLFDSVRHLFDFFPRNRHPRAT